MSYSLSDHLWIGWGLPVRGTPAGLSVPANKPAAASWPSQGAREKMQPLKKIFCLSIFSYSWILGKQTNKKKSTNAGPTVVGAKGSKSSRPNKEKNWLQWLVMILCLGAFPTWTQYSVCEGGAHGYPEVLSHYPTPTLVLISACKNRLEALPDKYLLWHPLHATESKVFLWSCHHIDL